MSYERALKQKLRSPETETGLSIQKGARGT
jgi:hypothetical protein